jgi:hypothetical protein
MHTHQVLKYSKLFNHSWSFWERLFGHSLSPYLFLSFPLTLIKFSKIDCSFIDSRPVLIINYSFIVKILIVLQWENNLLIGLLHGWIPYLRRNNYPGYNTSHQSFPQSFNNFSHSRINDTIFISFRVNRF